MVAATADPTWLWRDCAHCGTEFGQPDDPGRKARFCSGRCRTAAYRLRKRRQEQAEQQRQRERANRQRARTHQPPPHAGSSRPRAFCGTCGGLRAAHTFHHDAAAHTRARRRYDALKAKAASTSYAHEADACNAKADQLRDKYGL